MNPKVQAWLDFLQSIALVGLVAYQASIAAGVTVHNAEITALIAALGAAKGHFSASPTEVPTTSKPTT